MFKFNPKPLGRKPLKVKPRILAGCDGSEDENSCWIWNKNIVRGYGQLKVNGKPCRAHRASWEAFVGPIPDGLWVLHKCDNPLCVNPKHLFLGTAQDNTDDMVNKGRDRKTANKRIGSKHHDAKLTEAQVLSIRELSSQGVKTKHLAELFNVSAVQINCIIRRIFWKHI